MKKDVMKVEVIFRTFKNGEVIALMPHEEWNHAGDCTSYLHMGQHGPADYDGVVSQTKLSKPDEYAPLVKELRSLGYELKIMKRKSRG